MKKLLALLFLLCLTSCSPAWATPDWSPAVEYKTSTQVTTSESAACNIVVSGIGVTAGDYVYLMDSSTGYSASAVIRARVVAPTANFTVPVPYNGSPCNLFTNGIYVDESTTSGTIYTDVQYLNAI